MNYYDIREAKLKIAEELKNRGWEIFNLKEDESDPMTDYYSPANWGGIAIKNGFVLVVDIPHYAIKNGVIETKNGVINYIANPKRYKWHIERDGKIIDKGINIAKFVNVPYAYIERKEVEFTEKDIKIINDFKKLVLRWEKIINDPKEENDTNKQLKQNINNSIKENNKIHTHDNKETKKEDIKVEVNFNTDKNGIELKFTDKPSEEIRESLKLNGFRWSRFNKVWYTKDTEEARNYLKEVGFLKSEEKRNPIKVENQNFKEIEYPKIQIEDIESYTIDKQLSKRENENGFFRSKERDYEQELQDYLTSCNKEILEVLKNTDNQKIIYNAKKYLQSYKKKYYELYLKMLTHKANNPSWVVTGRGNLNVNRYNKQCARYDNMLKEHSILTEEFNDRIDKIKNQIYKNKKIKEENQINNVNENELKEFDKRFKKVKIKINLSNVNNVFDNGDREITANQYENYFIFKNWACWRIYNKNGNQIGQVKTKQTLKDAKKLLYYIINSKAA